MNAEAERHVARAAGYLEKRDGRTSSAVWNVGERTADARALSYQYFEDVQHRFVRAVAPDLRRIGARNPRARRKCEAIVAAVGDGAMRLLRAAVDGLEDEDGDGTPV